MLDKSFRYGTIERYHINPVTECWEWAGSLNEKGYPKIKIEGKVRRAHIVFYEMKYGPVKDGYELHHICDNRKCVNPDHMNELTHAENLKHALRTRKQRHGY